MPISRRCRGATPTNVIPGSSGAVVRLGRNDDEHIIRCETSLNRNIAANPSRWAEDRDHPRHPLRRRAT